MRELKEITDSFYREVGAAGIQQYQIFLKLLQKEICTAIILINRYLSINSSRMRKLWQDIMLEAGRSYSKKAYGYLCKYRRQNVYRSVSVFG